MLFLSCSRPSTSIPPRLPSPLFLSSPPRLSSLGILLAEVFHSLDLTAILQIHYYLRASNDLHAIHQRAPHFGSASLCAHKNSLFFPSRPR
eukprot:749707-Hanusia_phi.AAC.3